MSGSKYFDKIAWTIIAIVLIVTVLFMNGGALGIEAMAHIMGYENRLFDNTKVHTIDIVMNNWDEFIDNATSEEYYTAAVVIDGESYKNVAIRGKGNTSLSSVSSMNSERYSFKVEFDHYDNSLTYHGLDKLSLNNLIQDSTMMKDYLTYTMMNEFGAAAPLCSFVYITVNGEDWGLYLAVEGIEDSFLTRNYGSNHGELYKPDSMSFGGGRGNGKDFSMENFSFSANSSSKSQTNNSNSAVSDMSGFDFSSMFGGSMPVRSDSSSSFGGGMPDMGEFDFSQMPGMTQSESNSDGKQSFSFGGMGGFGMGSSDVKLQYIDDNASSYSNIWNNAKTDITEADQERLIESLQKLSNGESIESVVDIEQVIRYFVVHNYVCNGDSYTGSMIHNYYLYEEDGQMAMIPWDYNLAFGTFQGGNAQSTVNTPIDAPVSGGSGQDRPMWYWILSDEAYTELYHAYYAEFLQSVDVVGIIDNAYNLIKSYVTKDPSAFFSYEEFETGVNAMRQFCTLRSESISMQLANGQTVSNIGYVQASDLNLSVMGSMGGGFGGGSMPSRDTEKGNLGSRDTTIEEPIVTPNSYKESKTEITESQTSDWSIRGTAASTTSGMPQNGGSNAPQMPNGYGGGQMPSGGNLPEGFDPSPLPEGFGGQMPNMGEIPEGMDPSQLPSDFGGELPEGFDPSSMFGGSIPGQSSDKNDSNSTNGSSSNNSNRPSRDNMQIPSGDFNMNGMGNRTKGISSWGWIGISVLVLGMGLLIAKMYRY